MPNNKQSRTDNAAIAGSNDPLEKLIRAYIDDYVSTNLAARVVANGLKIIGVGFRPIVDHISFRTHDVEKRSEEFSKYGYAYDAQLGIIEYENWWAKIYRRPGYPAVFIDQAFEGERGKGSVIPNWVKKFGDKTLHHVALLVDDIDQAVFFLEKQGVPFSDKVAGKRGADLRQIFSKPEMREGEVFSVLELTERHRGYCGFIPPQADGLMQSTRVK